MELLPNIIKCQIIHRITKIYGGFNESDTIIKLMNENIINLDLTTSNIDDELLKHIGSRGSKRLEQLHLAHLNSTTSHESLCDLITYLKNVRGLSIKDANIVDDYIVSLIAKYCPHLQYLNLERCQNVTDEAMNYIKDMKLTSLNLSYTRLTDEGMKIIEDSPLLNHLEDLSVKYTNISHFGLSYLNWQRIKYIGFEINDFQSKNDDARKGTGMCWFHRDIVLA